MANANEKTTACAIAIIEAWAARAVAAVRKENNRLAMSIEQRYDDVGAAQAGGELAFAAILATQRDGAPDGVVLLSDKVGFDQAREHKAQKSVGSMCRRIKDAE